MDLIEAACKEIGNSERCEGETAFPPIAKIKSTIAAFGEKTRAQIMVLLVDLWKAQWERDRAEDIAKGIPRGWPLDELEGFAKGKMDWKVPARPAGQPWDRLGMTEEQYEAECERKRSLCESMREVVQ